MRVHTLVRIDTRPLIDVAGEVRAFVRVRNEAVRLAAYLDHHRKLGINRFFIIDNGSDDGTAEFALQQPDCHVFITHDPFSEAAFDWVNALLDQYGVGYWCLTADADEWLVYPDYETRDLPAFTKALDAEGVEGVFALMLDMYGNRAIAETPDDADFLVACPYHDRSYQWRRKPMFPFHDVFGGPRLRVFYPELAGMSSLRQNAIRALRRVHIHLTLPPLITKIPLVRWVAGMRYESEHKTMPIRLADVTGALLHFKFLRDFHTRVVVEVARGQHFHGSSEYRRYLELLKKSPAASLYCDDSVRFSGSDGLVKLGLIRGRA